MIITSKRFALQPSNNLEALTIREAIDMAMDVGDSQNPRALPELAAARAAFFPLGRRWLVVDGKLAAIELGPDALELVALALRLLADWIDDPDYNADDRGLTSTEVRALAGMIDAWLITSHLEAPAVPSSPRNATDAQ